MSHEFLGKNVRVKLDDNIIAEGKLLGYGDGGDFELEDADGFVHHCWPMLSIEEILPEPEEADAATEDVRSSADAGEGSPEAEGSPGSEEAERSDASG